MSLRMDGHQRWAMARFSRWLMLLVLLLGLALWFAPTLMRSIVAPLNPDVLIHQPGGDGRVALTINDGPDTRTAGLLLDALAANNARATFFVLGRFAEDYPYTVQQYRAAGHGTGNHGWDDEWALFRGVEGARESLQKTREVLAPLGGSRWYRPGGGLFNRGIRNSANEAGYQLVLADVAPPAWFPTGLKQRYICSQVKDGSIIALDDVGARGEETAELIPRIAACLAARNLRLVSLGEL